MGKGIAIGLLLLALVTASAAYAEDDALSGERIVQQGNAKGATACVACHGVDGAGNAAAGYPRLSHLNADYLAAQLQAYQRGSRSNPIMQPIAKALSSAEIEAVSDYYAKQTAKVSAEQPEQLGSLQEGERLATRGAWDQTIPACMSCHGPGGSGVGTAFPALAGQHASYIRSQIQAWQSGQRKGDPNQLMEVVAQRLNDTQTEAVAAYFASLKPGQ